MNAATKPPAPVSPGPTASAAAGDPAAGGAAGPVVLGIDVGGSSVKAAPVEVDRGRVIGERLVLPTPSPATPAALGATVGAVVAHFGWSGPIGCTFPGVVRQDTTLTATHLDPGWVGLDAAALLQRVTGCTVSLTNDADAAGLAEAAFGAAAGHDGVVLVLTFGTGIGSALLSEGRLVPNTEFGLLPVRGRPAEERAAARIRTERGLSWRRYARLVNEYLAVVETVLWPDRIVIGGGVSADAAEWLHLLTARAEIVPAQLANDAGLIGAACWAAERRDRARARTARSAADGRTR